MTALYGMRTVLSFDRPDNNIRTRINCIDHSFCPTNALGGF